MRVDKAEDIIWRRIGDEVVIIKDDGLGTHVLNKTAAHVWEMYDGKRGLDEIAAAVCERFDAGLEEASEDVRELTDTLIKKRLLNEVQESR